MGNGFAGKFDRLSGLEHGGAGGLNEIFISKLSFTNSTYDNFLKNVFTPTCIITHKTSYILIFILWVSAALLYFRVIFTY
jgi:hypothetical protein